MTAAQQAQNLNRDTGGRYAEKSHAEVEGFTPPAPELDDLTEQQIAAWQRIVENDGMWFDTIDDVPSVDDDDFRQFVYGLTAAIGEERHPGFVTYTELTNDTEDFHFDGYETNVLVEVEPGRKVSIGSGWNPIENLTGVGDGICGKEMFARVHDGLVGEIDQLVADARKFGTARSDAGNGTSTADLGAARQLADAATERAERDPLAAGLEDVPDLADTVRQLAAEVERLRQQQQQ